MREAKAPEGALAPYMEWNGITSHEGTEEVLKV